MDSYDFDSPEASPYDGDDVQRFMAGYGLALATGDLTGIAACYAFPALVVHDDGALPVADEGVIHDSFRGAAERYRAQGLVAAVPHVQGVEQVDDALLWTRVRWSYQDEYGAEQDTESYRYVLRRSRTGFEICVVVTEG